MKKTFYLLLLVFVFACDDSDDFEPKTNAFGTQVQLEANDPEALSQRSFAFVTITTAQGEPYDFNEDGNASFDILAQFPECARDDNYLFQNQLFETKFVGEQCDSGVSPLDRSEEHTSELQSLTNLVCRLLLEKKKTPPPHPPPTPPHILLTSHYHFITIYLFSIDKTPLTTLFQIL